MQSTVYAFFKNGFLSALLLFTSMAYGQITIDQTVTPEELVTDYLVGSGVTVSNVTFNGLSGDQLNNQLGLYNGPSNFIEFDEGLVMATAGVDFITGEPGDFVDPNITGDPDLSALANGGGTAFTVNNCALLEFDFVPDFEFLTVGYVFGSTEYPSFTCTMFNDVFGFFVSGPGINGPFSNDAINIAVIPNTTIPVGINTVNSGEATAGGSIQNCLDANPNFIQDSIYFVDNNPTLDGDVLLPGMTTNLYANYILEVGETYHIKLAIADVSDGALDSGVFLEGASFSAFPLSGNEDAVFANGTTVNIFPNPAGEFVNLDISLEQSAEILVRIVDVAGKTVLEPLGAVQVEEKFYQQIDLSSLEQGAYFLELRNLDTGAKHVSRIQKTR